MTKNDKMTDQNAQLKSDLATWISQLPSEVKYIKIISTDDDDAIKGVDFPSQHDSKQISNSMIDLAQRKCDVLRAERFYVFAYAPQWGILESFYLMLCPSLAALDHTRKMIEFIKQRDTICK